MNSKEVILTDIVMDLLDQTFTDPGARRQVWTHLIFATDHPLQRPVKILQKP